jgi:hypothetical protein
MTSTMHFSDGKLTIRGQVYGRSNGLDTWACLSLHRDSGEFSFYCQEPAELDWIAAAAQTLAANLRVAIAADAAIDRTVADHSVSRETVELVS